MLSQKSLILKTLILLCACLTSGLCVSQAFIFLSCSGSDDWLESYKKNKCRMKEIQDKAFIEAEELSKEPSLRMLKLENELEEAKKKFKLEKENVGILASKAAEKYNLKLKKLKEDHSSKYGTREPELLQKRTEQLTKMREKDLAPFADDVTEIENREKSDTAVVRITAELDKVKAEIVKIHNSAAEKYMEEYKLLEEESRRISERYSEVTRSLNEEELKEFNSKKDYINANPCK
ncbi:MAG: hypothetical protein ACRDFC_06965 [Ignavibacteria bacterium]